ncbi:hypothetical protein E4T56_gene5291 [Termitomyces sp. T112]|nr:hypothetical protein E4T56_gene5291 [Termitomyces sp. T112]
MGHRRIQCSRYYEERIQASIRGVTEGQYKSYVEAAQDLKVNYKTFSNMFKNGASIIVSNVFSFRAFYS